MPPRRQSVAPVKATRPRVYARLKPLVGADAGKAELFAINDTKLEYTREDGERTEFGYDKIFPMTAQQDEVFEEIGQTSLASLRAGFNSTVLAYGQTGAGKTFSIAGAMDDAGGISAAGLVPQLLSKVFEMFGGDSEIKNFEVSMQYVELYNEGVQDLLGGRKPVDVTTDPSGGYQVKDAVKAVVKDPAQAMQVYSDGVKTRLTNMQNSEQLARSHALLIFNVSWQEGKGKRYGTINIVDLAGSEGLKKSGRGKAALEGIKINMSLTKLTLVAKCLAEGTKNVPFRESKLTMMLQKSLGGGNMLHVILALSNAADQVAEATAALRFGQTCLSIAVNPNANQLEKEQGDMKSVVKEQMQEINSLEAANEELKRQLEVRNSVVGGDVPDFLVAQHITQNKDALKDDLREATEQIEELKRAIDDKGKEITELNSRDAKHIDESQIPPGLDANARADAVEKLQRQAMVAKMQGSAVLQTEKKAFEKELESMLEIQATLQKKLEKVDADEAAQQERISAEAEERAKEILAEKEEQMKELAAMQAAREEAARAAAEEQKKLNEELQAQLRQRDEMLAQEEAQRKMLMETTQADNSQLSAQLADLAAQREAFEKNIEGTKADQAKLQEAEAEAAKAAARAKEQEAELEKMRREIAAMASGAPGGGLKRGGSISSALGGAGFKPVPDMIKLKAKKMERAAKAGRTDPVALQRVLQTLPVLSACNDLRALTELEATNRTLFQTLGGVYKMVDYLAPHGPNAPYATHIARTLPTVMDKEGRQLFHDYATGVDAHGEVRLTYLTALLKSRDPDDKEHACLAIAAVAQDSNVNREAFFKAGVSQVVLEVLLETCQQQMPRQRLQRVVVMALSELAQDFEPFKDVIRTAGGVQQLLLLLSPSHDPFVIKETLALIGRITMNNQGIQTELQSLGAIQVYSQLLFAQMHDSAITELAALALVNLVSEVPSCMATVEQHPRYAAIRFELLASMARALSSSMTRLRKTTAALPGSAEFGFWGAAAVGYWDEGTAGGDRTHTSFVENPQYILKASAGTNLCIVLHDSDEDKRQKEKTKSRPLFLRLCVASATQEALDGRSKVLDINSSGARPAAMDADSVVQLEPGVNGFLDVAKTREVTMRCTVKSAEPHASWVIVPHVGCSHQHAKFVLSVFADREVSLEEQLQPWSKRIITSGWSQLACAPSSIVDANWRNCPQFQLINMGTKPTPVRALLSYGERDEMLNKRHLQTFDQQMATAEERPMLSMYVMKANVPDKRFVATLSPQVDNYVTHSLVTNSWCVQAKWQLEPGDVYNVLAVMAEGTTHEVPLRLSLFTEPDLDAGTVVSNPLSAANEWHATVLQGFTGGDGSNTLTITPEGAPGEPVQATLVIETEETAAFCSISTMQGDAPYKQTPTYAQKQAVLSVPLQAGSPYTMITRCITQRQEPIKNGGLRILLYSSVPLGVAPAAGQQLAVSIEAADKMVSQATAPRVLYGEETVPEDTKKPEVKEEEAEASYDPAVVQAVLEELEQQRNNLYAYAKESGSGEPPAILEQLRKQNEELKLKADELRKAGAGAKAMAERQGGAADKEAASAAQAQVAKLREQVAELEAKLAAGGGGAAPPPATGGGGGSAALKAAQKQAQEATAKAQALEQKLKAAQAKGGGGGGGGSSDLEKEVERLQKENAAQKAEIAAGPKSAACLVM